MKNPKPARRWGVPMLFAALTAAMVMGCGGREPEIVEPPEPQPLKILQFYPGALQIRPGEEVSLCYGVENAASVRIEPDGPEIDPSPNRCVMVTPEKTTTYTFHATGEDGSEQTQTAEVRVSGAPVARGQAGGSAGAGLITLFAANVNTAAPGQQVTICYQAPEATSLRLQPAAAPVKAGGRNCFTVSPKQTTTYRLTATGPSGTDTQSLTIRVR
jgi:hypothetical protein